MLILRRIILALAGLAVLTATAGAADIPRMINYQAIVTDDLGDPLSQDGVSFEFSIHDASVLGTQLWMEGPVVKDIADGLLSHAMGSVVPLPDSLFTKYGELWLEVKVEAEALTRVQLLASGYAFRVSTVDSARGGAIVGDVSVFGGVGGSALYVESGPGGDAAQFRDGDVVLQNAAGTETIELDSHAGAAGGQIVLRKFDSTTTMTLDAAENGRAQLSLYHNDGSVETVELLGTQVSDGTGGVVTLYTVAGTPTVQLDAENGTSGGRIVLQTLAGQGTVDLEAETSLGGARLSMGNDAGVITLRARATETGSDGAEVRLSKANGLDGMILDAEVDGTDGAVFEMMDGTGTQTVLARATETGSDGAEIRLKRASGADGIIIDAELVAGPVGGGGARIDLYNGAGAVTVSLDSDVSGDGRVITEVLEITGGADLSEQFDISPGSAAHIEPGMVLSIDPAHTGRLRVSEKAYDPTVAGIVSGAGGVKTGMLMGQSGSLADGQHAVALTGRVWCKVDASYGAIRPGDLLTTSTTPGHAMKATDGLRTQGAIIGKAMSSLEAGTGLVLVLVSLQ